MHGTFWFTRSEKNFNLLLKWVTIIPCVAGGAYTAFIWISFLLEHYR